MYVLDRHSGRTGPRARHRRVCELFATTYVLSGTYEIHGARQGTCLFVVYTEQARLDPKKTSVARGSIRSIWVGLRSELSSTVRRGCLASSEPCNRRIRHPHDLITRHHRVDCVGRPSRMVKPRLAHDEPRVLNGRQFAAVPKRARDFRFWSDQPLS